MAEPWTVMTCLLAASVAAAIVSGIWHSRRSASGSLVLTGALMPAAVAALGGSVWLLPPSHTALARANREADLVFLVDVSLSMSVSDVGQTRLELARRIVLQQIARPGLADVAVMAFAGEPAWLCPFTADREAALGVVSELSAERVGSGGTAIGAALDLAVAAARARGRAACVLVLTDGEETKSEAALWDAVRNAAASGVSITAVGVGTATGGPVPGLGSDPLNDVADGHASSAPSRLDEARLARMAEQSDGVYFRGIDLVAAPHLFPRTPDGQQQMSQQTSQNRGRTSRALMALAGCILIAHAWLRPDFAGWT